VKIPEIVEGQKIAFVGWLKGKKLIFHFPQLQLEEAKQSREKKRSGEEEESKCVCVRERGGVRERERAKERAALPGVASSSFLACDEYCRGI